MVRRLVQRTGGTLLEVMVGQKAVWKSADHPFRHHPQLRLTGIPTLIHWVAAGLGARLGMLRKLPFKVFRGIDASKCRKLYCMSTCQR